MIVQCEKCGRLYDDTQRWTICPHRPLGVAPLTRRERMAAQWRLFRDAGASRLRAARYVVQLELLLLGLRLPLDSTG